MFEITLLAMGKLKEKFYTEASAEYVKRLSRFCKLEILELPEDRLPDDPSQGQIDAALAKEGVQHTKEEVVSALEAIVEPVSLYEPVYTGSGDAIYVMDQVGDIISGLIGDATAPEEAPETAPEVDPEVLLLKSENDVELGCYYDVEITGADEFDLYGKVM